METNGRVDPELSRSSKWVHAFVIGVAVIVLGVGQQAYAYSYAAAGAEPLIEAREATLAALGNQDIEQARSASLAVVEELQYLDREFQKSLADDLKSALEDRDSRRVDGVYLAAFAVEIQRRLTAAGEQLDDYQVAKSLVVRSKRYFDLLAPRMEATARVAGGEALRSCLAAIGNPGVFGVGARAADAEEFARGREIVLRSLGSLVF